MMSWLFLLSGLGLFGFSENPDSTRYGVAVFCLLTFLAPSAFWLVIHPFVSFWRSKGLVPAYIVASIVLVGTGTSLCLFREQLMGRDLGNHWLLLALAVVLYAVATWIEVQCRKTLEKRTLTGVPELRNESSSETLLNTGIYRLIRHPRYLSIITQMLAFSIAANYLGIFVLLVVAVCGVVLIGGLEERELVQRFGAAYKDYRNEVPRLIPTRASLRAFRNETR